MLLLSVLLFLPLADDNMSLDEAKEFVGKYYSNIQKTVITGKEPASVDDYISMFGSDKNNNPIYSAIHNYPNYMYALDNDGERLRHDCPESIFGELADYRNSHSDMFVTCECSGIKYCVPPELSKDEESPQFACILYQTKWTIAGKTIVIDDTVYVDLKHKNIPRICNRISPLVLGQEMTVDDMLVMAIALYDNKKYSEAADLYRQIIQIEPSNAEAWYALGVMYFKGQGVGKLSGRNRLHKAYDCWKMSSLPKARRAISYITDGRE